MTEARWRSLMRDHSLELTQAEICAGWHFCPCWDGLLIGDKMGELEHCHCHREITETQHKYMNTSPLSDKLSEEWCNALLINGEKRTKLRQELSKLIYGIICQPRLGNATTGELLDEVKARVNCAYKTAGD